VAQASVPTRQAGKSAKKQAISDRLSLRADHNAPRGVDAVDLKHAFGRIKTESGNLHGGRLLSAVSSNDDHVRHSMPFSRGRPPHQLRRSLGHAVRSPHILRRCASHRKHGSSPTTSAIRLSNPVARS
jgi:hypothetical protein